MEWIPILSGRDKSEVEEKIHQIAKFLLDVSLTDLSPGLFHGISGISIFLYNYYQWTDNEEFYEKASELTQVVFEFTGEIDYKDIEKGKYGLSLSEGLAGIGWYLNYIIDQDIIEGDMEEIFGYYDAWIYREMIKKVKSNIFGLLKGSTGLAVYCFSRGRRFEQEYLKRWIHEIYMKLDNIRNNTHTEYGIPYGLHGVYILIDKFESKYGKTEYSEKTKNIIENFWGLGTFFSTPTRYVAENIPGWSDPNLCLAMMMLDNPKYEKIAHKYIAHYAGSWQNTSTQLSVDKGLLGGMTSLVHIYNRLYNRYGHEYYKDAAVFFLKATLKNANYVDTRTGFKLWLTEEKGLYGINYGLAGGLSGVGLALLSTVSSMEPVWDEIFLLS